MLRASSLPALAQCPSFQSGDTAWLEDGTDRHAALEAHFRGDDSLLDLLIDENRAGVLWAADQIRATANLAEHPLTWEKENSTEAVLENFEVITGTPDAVCELTIWDLKWRWRH